MVAIGLLVLNGQISLNVRMIEQSTEHVQIKKSGV